MDAEAQITRRFQCPKCRGREAVARTVALGRSSLPALLPMSAADKPNRFVLVSCALCGYTEMYNLALYVAAIGADAEAVFARGASATTPSSCEG